MSGSKQLQMTKVYADPLNRNACFRSALALWLWEAVQEPNVHKLSADQKKAIADLLGVPEADNLFEALKQKARLGAGKTFNVSNYVQKLGDFLQEKLNGQVLEMTQSPRGSAPLITLEGLRQEFMDVVNDGGQEILRRLQNSKGELVVEDLGRVTGLAAAGSGTLELDGEALNQLTVEDLLDLQKKLGIESASSQHLAACKLLKTPIHVIGRRDSNSAYDQLQISQLIPAVASQMGVLPCVMLGGNGHYDYASSRSIDFWNQGFAFRKDVDSLKVVSVCLSDALAQQLESIPVDDVASIASSGVDDETIDVVEGTAPASPVPATTVPVGSFNALGGFAHAANALGSFASGVSGIARSVVSAFSKPAAQDPNAANPNLNPAVTPSPSVAKPVTAAQSASVPAPVRAATPVPVVSAPKVSTVTFSVQTCPNLSRFVEKQLEEIKSSPADSEKEKQAKISREDDVIAVLYSMYLQRGGEEAAALDANKEIKLDVCLGVLSDDALKTVQDTLKRETSSSVVGYSV